MLLLHLSDLHFGSHSRFGDGDEELVATAFCHQLAQAKDDAGLPAGIDLVCVTGDLTETAHKKELHRAGVFSLLLPGRPASTTSDLFLCLATTMSPGPPVSG